MNLKRLDTRRLRVLVIQYSDNDFDENDSFYRGHNHLQTMSRKQYLAISNAQEPMDHYYFGKHLRYAAKLYSAGLRNVMKRVTEAIAKPPPSETVGTVKPPDFETRAANVFSPLNEAELFLNVLMHGNVNLKGVEIIVFEISNFARSGDRFFRLLQASRRSNHPAFRELSIKAINVATLLGPQHYYRLDGHLNTEGHEVMANAIIEQSPLLRGAAAAQSH
jgi:hypothetical protein